MGFSSGSFATFLIVCPTSFFLGIVFSLLPYDYPLLWSTIPATASHFDSAEAHLKLLHQSPPLVPRILHIVMFLGFAGMIMKLYKPSESNMLFDGASLVLYVCGVIVYISNIVKGLRIISEGGYGANPKVQEVEGKAADQILGREDSMKVLSASNTILALVLVGVLVLQAGQWYAEKREQQEAADMDKKDEDARKEKEKEQDKEKEKESPRITRQSSATKKKQ